MKSHRSIGLVRVFLVAALCMMTGSAFAADSVTQTVTGGARSASIADLVLGTLSYSHDAQVQTGTMTLTADDSTGTGAGWNVTIEASDFVYSGTAGGADISAANFSITTADAPAMTAGMAVDATNGPKVPASGATGALDSARKVIQADASYGLGTYTQDLETELSLPEQTRAGTYASMLTVTIAAAP